MLNLIFCILSLAESCVVLFLSHYKEEHLVPLWMVEMFWTCVPTPVKSMMSRKQIVPAASAIADVGDGADKMTRVAKKKLASMKSSTRPAPSSRGACASKGACPCSPSSVPVMVTSTTPGASPSITIVQCSPSRRVSVIVGTSKAVPREEPTDNTG